MNTFTLSGIPYIKCPAAALGKAKIDLGYILSLISRYQVSTIRLALNSLGLQADDLLSLFI